MDASPAVSDVVAGQDPPDGSSPRRVVAHLDLDCFFAAVEQRDDPALQGRPVVVAGDGPRGVVATASYEARALGVRSAMPVFQARRLAPGAVFVPVRRQAYADASAAVFALAAEAAPVLAQVSVDEAWLDFGVSSEDAGAAKFVASRMEALRARVASEVGLASSAGVSASRLVAKVASGAAKPNGLVVVAPGDEAVFLAPFAVSALPGVGPRTAEALVAAGVRSVADVAAYPELVRAAVSERTAGWLAVVSVGTDQDRVVPAGARQSLSTEETFDRDLVPSRPADRQMLATAVMLMADRLLGRLAARASTGATGELGAKTVTLKLRRAFEPSGSRRGPSGGWQSPPTRTRSVTFPQPVSVLACLAGPSVALLEEALAADPSPVRLVGLSLSALSSPDPVLFTCPSPGPVWVPPSLPPPGARVFHRVFGPGSVLASRPAASPGCSDGCVRVRFDDGALRDLDPALAGLTPA